MTKPLSAKDRPDLAGFDWEDPFRLSDQLSEDERMIAESARAYLAQRGIDYANSYPLNDTTVLYYWRATYWRRLAS